jgi:hypothetical protein
MASALGQFDDVRAIRIALYADLRRTARGRKAPIGDRNSVASRTAPARSPEAFDRSIRRAPGGAPTARGPHHSRSITIAISITVTAMGRTTRGFQGTRLKRLPT